MMEFRLNQNNEVKLEFKSVEDDLEIVMLTKLDGKTKIGESDIRNAIDFEGGFVELIANGESVLQFNAKFFATNNFHFITGIMDAVDANARAELKN